jgi:hypothetical protein
MKFYQFIVLYKIKSIKSFRRSKLLKKTIITILVILVGIQFIDVDKTNPPVDKEIALQTDEDVMKVLRNSCYDCHSNETKWPTYSSIAPISFFVASHVNKGRKALNFSLWQTIEPDIKLKRLERAIKTVNNEMMALPSYVSVHDNAKLTKEQKDTLTQWFEKEIQKLNNN